MNWDQLAGKWRQSKGKIRERWGKLTDDELDVVAGRREQFVGLLQEHYGVMRQVAEEQVHEFLEALGEEPEKQRRAAARR
jgi:uncharacterized protein YjbJ (UPF0337 family)